MFKNRMDQNKTDGSPDQDGAPSIDAPLREVFSDTATERKKPPRLLLLLLFFLLAVLGAGVYFIYVLPSSSATARPDPPARQPIAIPEKPAAPKMSDAVKPASPENRGGSEDPGEKYDNETLKKKPAFSSAGASEPRSEASSAKAGIAAEISKTEKTDEPIAAKAEPTEPVAEKKEQPVADAVSFPQPEFTLNVGAYLIEGNLKETEGLIRQLGYEPRLEEIARPVEMVRLRIGEFPPEEARDRLANLADSAPDAFLVHGEKTSVVYAASYFNLDRARRFADRLFLKGIRVEEEPAQVEKRMTLVSFGEFPDRASADAAAGRIREAGLDVQVISRR